MTHGEQHDFAISDSRIVRKPRVDGIHGGPQWLSSITLSPDESGRAAILLIDSCVVLC